MAENENALELRLFTLHDQEALGSVGQVEAEPAQTGWGGTVLGAFSVATLSSKQIMAAS